MRFTGVFWKLYDAVKERHPRYVSMPGGTRSGKTYSILQFLHLLVPQADKAGDVTSVVSETIPHLKRGAIRDYEDIIGHPLKTDPNWNATDYIYTYPNGAKLEFFSADSPSKCLGPARKRLFLNEANHIGWEIVRQLLVRTTGLVILDYNPASVFWAMEKVEWRDNCVTIRSTYKDNNFLSPEQIAEIESNRDDANWWKVYGLGEVGSLEGLIYTFDLVAQMPPKGRNKSETEKTPDELYADSLVEVQGLDFGFTHDPTARVRLLADPKRKEVWVQQMRYRVGMVNDDIADDILADTPRGVEIFADCAEPKSIEEIRRRLQSQGIRITACDKDAPVKSAKLKFQLQWMQGWKYHFTQDSLDLIDEGRNYCWARDKDGNLINEPIDKFNHALDAMRYALWTKFGKDSGKGQYTVHIGNQRRIRR